MHLKKMDVQQVADLYENHMIHDFPRSELKPLWAIKAYMEKGICTVQGLCRGEELLAYAILLHNKDSGFQLLDYFASNRKQRGKGYGSLLLERLKKEDRASQGYLIEVESVAGAKNQEERTQRTRRIAFYEKNGLRKTGIRAVVFGVEFEILYLPLRGDEGDARLYEELKALYVLMVGEERFGKHIAMELA